MALRQILEYPNPLLKKRAAPVATIGGEVATLIEDLVETMYAAPGVGLAATQVGVGQRVIVLDIHGEDEAPGKRLLKLINPEIAEREGEVVWEEGCLSVPDLTAPVKRARRVPDPGSAPGARRSGGGRRLPARPPARPRARGGGARSEALRRGKPAPRAAARAPARRRLPGRAQRPRARPRRGRRLREDPAA